LAAEPPTELITTYEQAVGFLDARIGHGVKPGLERIAGLLDVMTNPHESYSVIHIGGTNGKTTTARMISALLEAHGLHVGTFTSPHLLAIEERFTISGRNLDREAFVEAVADVAPFVEFYERSAETNVTYFEVTAAIAFQAFAAAGVDVAVVEVGLGGRLDATNVVNADVSVATGIALDHMSYLGSTIGEIAREKAAILKQSGILVTGPLPAAAEGAFTARVSETESAWHRFGADFEAEDPVVAVGGWQADIQGVDGRYEEVYLPLHGRHQIDHLATSIAACELFFGHALNQDAVLAAALELKSPGRIEVVGRSPLIVVDGAHNEQGIEGLADALETEFLPSEWVLVVGARGDRDLGKLMRPLLGAVRHVIATEPIDPAAIPAAEVARAAAEVFGDDVPVEVVTPVAQAITEAIALVDETGSIIITGSLYVVGETLSRLKP
jgi:dihydrofolate synthase/folylpolyglutamate synthase